MRSEEPAEGSIKQEKPVRGGRRPRGSFSGDRLVESCVLGLGIFESRGVGRKLGEDRR